MTSQSNVVAIIDDQTSVLHAYARIVRAFGFDAELYCSAEDFISATSLTRARCLIVDIHLRDLSGIEMIRHLSAIGFVRPTIFITGSDDGVLLNQAAELGPVAILRKPTTSRVLMGAIDSAIGSRPVS